MSLLLTDFQNYEHNIYVFKTGSNVFDKKFIQKARHNRLDYRRLFTSIRF